MKEKLRIDKPAHSHDFINSALRRDTKNVVATVSKANQERTSSIYERRCSFTSNGLILKHEEGNVFFFIYIMCILSFCCLHCLSSTALLIFCLSSNSASLCGIKPVLSYTRASCYTGFSDYRVVTRFS